MGHVQRFGSISQVDVKKGKRVPGKPAGLNRDGTASDGPLCSVCRRWHPATCATVSNGTLSLLAKILTWIHPLHSVWKTHGTIIVVNSKRTWYDVAIRIRSVGVESVSSPSGICYDGVSGD